MSNNSPEPLTDLLVRWRSGDSGALAALMPLIYRELRATARRFVSGEKPGHTLQSTALVHEVYERLVEQELPQWQNRAHFFAVAAQLMRQILVDHARARAAAKRGANRQRLSLTDAGLLPVPMDIDVVALDDALKDLAVMDAQQARVVELKFFAGLSNDETAQALGVSTSTVKRDWLTARAWLYRELSRNPM